MKTPSSFASFVLAACMSESSAHPSSSHRRLISTQDAEYAQLLFERFEPLVVRSTASSLCLESGNSVGSPMTYSECGTALDRQSFVFDTVSGQLQTPKTLSYCVDYGTSSSPSFHLQACSAASSSQQFSFDLNTGHVSSVTNPGLCLDSTTGAPQLVACVDTAIGQGFSVVAAKEVEPRSATSVTTASGEKIPIPDVFHNQLPFLLVGKHKSNLCLSDGGEAQLNGNTTFEMATCGADTTAQTFVFDPATLQIKSVARPGLCINDGKGQKLPPFLHLEQCATLPQVNTNQQWIFDESTSQIVNPNYLTPMCVDDGSGLLPGQTKVYLDWCRTANTNQAFQIQPTTYVPPLSPTKK